MKIGKITAAGGGRRNKRAAPPMTEGHQAMTFSRRALFVGGAQAAVGTLLVGRMAWLSIAENERYTLLAEDNRVEVILVPPRRGWILDRNSQPLAINRSDFRVDLIPQQLKDADRIVPQLAQLLQLNADEIDRINRELKGAKGFKPVIVAENIDYDKYAAVTLRLPELPGVNASRGFSRFYPEGAAVGHLIGYVGAASAADYEKERNPLLITPGFKIGKEGLEKILEQRMRGVPGAQRVEVSARGKLIRELEARPDRSGAPVQLTIDAGLQAYAARRMGNESGAVVVLDCLTGDMLAMASMPAYDPNSFSDGIGRAEWKMLSDDERRPLNNKVLGALYPPGSTIKPMVAMALQANGVDPKETVFCGGGFRLGNRTFRCLGRHGTVDMTRAIAKSCNTYFYSMGRRIGYDAISDVAKLLGLGTKFDLPVVSQSFGTVPSSEWKQRKYKQDWTQSDTLNASIGQGYLIVNPLQLAVMSARIASGLNVAPRLVMGDGPQPAHLSMPEEHFATVRAAMSQVVNGDGTAGRSKLPLDGILMGGKTGTAQVRRITGGQRGQSGAWKYRDHGLFVCFAPVDKPRYAASVVIDHGMGGSRAAAPVARDVLTYLFDKEKAMATLLEFEAGWGGTIQQRMAAQAEAWRRTHGSGTAVVPPVIA